MEGSDVGSRQAARGTAPARSLEEQDPITDEGQPQGPGDREPHGRGAPLPARSGLHRAGERHGRPLRGGGPGLRGVLGSPRPFPHHLEQAVRHVLEWDLPFAKWFTGGTLNISENCLDRHVANGLGDKVAYHWIGEPGDTRTITYADLLDEVQKTANALKELGVETGDRSPSTCP